MFGWINIKLTWSEFIRLNSGLGFELMSFLFRVKIKNKLIEVRYFLLVVLLLLSEKFPQCLFELNSLILIDAFQMVNVLKRSPAFRLWGQDPFDRNMLLYVLDNVLVNLLEKLCQKLLFGIIRVGLGHTYGQLYPPIDLTSNLSRIHLFTAVGTEPFGFFFIKHLIFSDLFFNSLRPLCIIERCYRFLYRKRIRTYTRYHQAFCISSQWVFQDSSQFTVPVRNMYVWAVYTFLWILCQYVYAVPKSQKRLVNIGSFKHFFGRI